MTDPTSALPERVLRKAAREGRIRGIAVDTWSRAVAQPRRAGHALRTGVSQARALHSRERRLVQQALYDLVRRQRAIERVLGSDAPLALWLGWLVQHGLPPQAAKEQLDLPYEALLDDTLATSVEGLDPAERLAILHSLPLGLSRRLVDQRGEAHAARLLAASDERAPITIRANQARTTRDALAARLADEGLPTSPCERAPHGLHVLERGALTALPSFREGWFEVQDEGSQLLAALVPAGGEVIDLCAGAGGKSLALAAAGHRVTAADVRPGALAELQRRARRAGARIETIRIRDGRLPPKLRKREVGRVLVDAPCSGTGVLRRHPEHRWQFDDGLLKERTALQRRILDRAAGLVAPGGSLVYGTCSLLAEENEHVVSSFLSGHPDFEATDDVLHTAPHPDGTDGFFGAVLRRRSAP
jgi:16S rRNA (cytosine967-C5)-methyltransferase